VLKKLLAVVVVALTAAVMAVPAFAQSADLTLEWGSDEWLINQFGDENGDVTTFCNTLAQNPDVQAGWVAEFPNLPGLCGWSQ
jgi:hypothetical protein